MKINYEQEVKATRFSSALLAWTDFKSVVEHYGAECVNHVKDSITLEIVSDLEPSKFSDMEEMKSEFLHAYETRLKELGL